MNDTLSDERLHKMREGAMNPGDRCRSILGSPGVYIGGGLCLYVSAQDSELGVTPAREADEHDFPVPTAHEIEIARMVVRAMGVSW